MNCKEHGRSAYGRLTYWDPCCHPTLRHGLWRDPELVASGDAFLVELAAIRRSNNIPMDKKAFSPRLGFAYAFQSERPSFEEDMAFSTFRTMSHLG